MSNFTKGPWSEGAFTHQNWWSEGNFRELKDTEGKPFAQVQHKELSHKGMSDFNLMKSAPELYEALNHITDYIGVSGMAVDNTELQNLMIEATYAIQKAQGVQ